MKISYPRLKKLYDISCRTHEEARRLFLRYGGFCMAMIVVFVILNREPPMFPLFAFMGIAGSLALMSRCARDVRASLYGEVVKAQEQAVSQAETLYQKGLATGDFTELDEFILGSENTGLADSFTVNFNHLFYMRGMIEIFAGFSTERKLAFLRDPGIYRGLVEPGYWTPPTGCDRYIPLALSDCEEVYYSNIWGDSECEYQSHVSHTTRLTLLACEKQGIWYLAASSGEHYRCYPLDAVETLFSADFDPFLYMASREWEFVVEFKGES